MIEYTEPPYELFFYRSFYRVQCLRIQSVEMGIIIISRSFPSRFFQKLS